MMRPLLLSPKPISALARFLGSEDLVSARLITGITSNSDDVLPGDLFLALPGANHHGADFIEMAKARGALAVVTDLVGAEKTHLFLTTIVISDPRHSAGDIAAWVYDFPFHSMIGIGITGTNGKTTTTSLLHQLWQLDGRNVGSIGTIGIEIGRDHYPVRFTTPEACDLQATVASMRECLVTHLVMEASSHAIDQSRLVGSHFSVSAFTNLTQDHLDYHGTMEQYFAVKAKLFTSEYSDIGYVNIDDPYGQQLVELATIPLKTVSRTNIKADWHYTAIQEIKTGFEVSLRGTGGILIEGYLPLIGDHNLDNTLMAIALGVESGLDPIAIAANLARLMAVSGRLESINLGQGFRALVDFAHTPDAVIRVLKTLRTSGNNRIIAVLGCGGDRDRTKRPVMGRALLELADVAIFTSDNPRSESPTVILDEMTADLRIDPPNLINPDRRSAIAYAVSQALPGDTVVVLGKGHEQGQEISGVKHPFDDRRELASAIEARS